VWFEFLRKTVVAFAFVALALAEASAADRAFKLTVEATEPTRFYLDDSSGKSWAPDGAIRYARGNEKHFIVKSRFDLQLPAGAYTLIAERGLEYRPFRAGIEARAGEERKIQVVLKRWIDMNRLGWYSGDLHNHRRPEDMPLLLLAEDLNLTPTLADWIWENGQNSMPPKTNEAIRQVDARHVYSVLDKEVERLKNGPGAVDLVGLRSTIPFNGYLLYPPNDIFTKQAHAQGAWVDAEKIVWRDVAALVALGHVDFAGIVHNHFSRQGVETETDSWGMIPKDRPEFNTPAGMPLWAMEVYYRFLNCGFRLAASAGSASGVKAAPVGYNRVYVKLNGPFNYERWFRALKEGRSFATNGPVLFLTVDGAEPGGLLRFPEKKPRRVRIHAEASSLHPMDRLEVLFKGKPIRTVTGMGKLVADFSTEIAETGWFAARAFEKPDRAIRFAHTSPVYAEFSGDAGIVRADAQFFIKWIEREMAFYKNLPDFREPAHREAMLALFSRARQVYARLAEK
jgi:hypothetical protein